MCELGDMPVRVAVLIATYNRAHLIGATLDSVLAQTRRADGIIVVDDGSTDATAAVLSGYGDRIRVLRLQTNAGKSAALNHALPEIDARYVCVFDDDDLMLPEAIATHLAALEAEPSRDFTYSDHYLFTDERDIETIKSSARRLRLPAIEPDRFLLWTLEQAFLPTHMQGMLIPTTCLRVLGGFDTTLARSQDRDMVIRLATEYRPLQIPRALWAFRQHAGARGPLSEHHRVDQRFAVWKKYKHRVFIKVRRSLDIEDYVSPCDPIRARPDASTPDRVARHGLLTRARVMATHGLWSQAADDFGMYLARVANSPPAAMDAAELEQVARLFNIHDLEDMPNHRQWQRLGGLARRHAALRRAAFKGLYWSLNRALRTRQLEHTLSLVRATILMLVAKPARVGQISSEQ